MAWAMARICGSLKLWRRRATAMARGAEFYRMLRITDFRLQHVVLSSQLGDVNQITLLRRLPRTFIDCHCLILLVQMLKS
ncbi:Uncharacterised protein [Klebsiella pneumoniae]|uniref:Uncharacterized protein n=1 Tax=Klebsiella pneumoniae TaxID=573 RepID=A0A2X3IXV2_KLEPN|nr:Uncharacterised protein [Klebsiella pneumoniae]